ncbi:hypothetical protein ACKQTC_08260 [Peptococcus simiae]|uniref:Uncharacterized protein n=1 Tax=Peptococcus simiae TaxID=1643805 RepID=A0ABW9H0M7_9FIRM
MTNQIKKPHAGSRQRGAKQRILPRIPGDSLADKTVPEKSNLAKSNMVASPQMLALRALFYVSALMFIYSALRVDSGTLTLLGGLGRMTMWLILAAVGVFGFEEAKRTLFRKRRFQARK